MISIYEPLAFDRFGTGTWPVFIEYLYTGYIQNIFRNVYAALQLFL